MNRMRYMGPDIQTNRVGPYKRSTTARELLPVLRFFLPSPIHLVYQFFESRQLILCQDRSDPFAAVLSGLIHLGLDLFAYISELVKRIVANSMNLSLLVLSEVASLVQGPKEVSSR